MLNILQISFIILSAILVIIADALLKKISYGSVWQVIMHPLFFIAAILYLIQIILAVYVFLYKSDLGIYAVLYVIFYAIAGIIIGILFFNEKVSLQQFIGLLLGLISILLINKS